MPTKMLTTEELLHETTEELGKKESVKKPHALTPELLRKMNAYWRAANYVSVGQIYLYDNPLLKEPLKLSHVKPLVVSHWGTTPGQNFIYVHLNRAIKKYDLNMFYIAGLDMAVRRSSATYILKAPGASLSERHPGRGRAEEAVQAVLLPRRHLQPRCANDAGIDSRGRGAGLLA